MWAGLLAYFYHLYLVFNVKKPEEYPLVQEQLLGYAMDSHWLYNDVKNLLTRPPVASLLMPRPPLPPGQQYMKTLVLNLQGTIVHSEYKVRI